MSRLFKINEIFYSLQGEGFHVGTPAVFVRFSGCNLRCDFCDTMHNDGHMMSVDQVLERVLEFPARHVILTGGEPSLFVDHDFVQTLKSRGLVVHMETNGTNELPDNIDWVTFSPKENHVLKKADELKVVYLGQDMSIWNDFDAKVKYVQPCTMADETETKKNIERTVEFVKANPDWRLSVQLHKLISIP